MSALHQLFVEELNDRLDSQHQQIAGMPRMAAAATCTQLQQLFHAQLMQTSGQVEKIGRVFQSFNLTAGESSCTATVGMLLEGERLVNHFGGSPAINAAMNSIAQKIENCDVASYGCLHDWALLLGNSGAAILLQELHEEAKSAMAALIELAQTPFSKEALREKGPATSDRYGHEIVVP